MQVHEATVNGYTETFPSCASVVPLLCNGAYDVTEIAKTCDHLTKVGSYAADGWKKPEGVVVYLPEANYMYKVSIDNNDAHKGEVND